MTDISSSNPPMPVIRDAAQLDAYMAAWAAGNLQPVLGSLHLDRSAWLELAGIGGDAAWDQAEKFGFPLVDMSQFVRSPQLKALFPDAAGRRLHATPLLTAYGYLAVAIDAGTEESMVSTLGFVTNQPIIPLVATIHARLGKSFAQYEADEDRKIATQLGLKPGQRNEQRLAGYQELVAGSPMVQTMRSMMAMAIHQRPPISISGPVQRATNCCSASTATWSASATSSRKSHPW